MKKAIEVVSNLTEEQRTNSFSSAGITIVVYMASMSIITCYFEEISRLYKDNNYLEITSTFLAYTYTPLLLFSLAALVRIESIPVYNRTQVSSRIKRFFYVLAQFMLFYMEMIAIPLKSF